MSQSSLPDIFKKSQTLQLQLHRQSPSFSLRINPNSTTCLSTIHNSYTQRPVTSSHTTLTKAKSISTQRTSTKQPNLHEIKEFCLHDLIDKNRINFFQQERRRKTSHIHQKLNVSTQKNTFFPYQTNNRFNNNTMQLEEADNLKNKTINAERDIKESYENINLIKSDASSIKKQLKDFSQSLTLDLQVFQKNFQNAMKMAYQQLSSLRRETNDEMKSNKLELQKSKQEIQICSSFTVDLKNKTSFLYDMCLKNQENFQQVQDWMKAENLDFQQISSIRKSSRGATGQLKRHNNNWVDRDQKRKSANLIQFVNGNKILLNGGEIDLANFQEQ